MALNPFIWDRPLDDPAKIIGMEHFANRVALILKGQTNVALFGPRDTGKTTFTNQLALELAKTQGDDAPPFDVVKVDLQRVVSIPGFIGCVYDAMISHPVKHLRRAAQRQIAALEKEIGFDIKVIKGSVKRPGLKVEQDAEALHAQLLALRSLSHHLVVVFDEFQRLRHCPGEPLAIIRSALMSSGANHVSLMFTGSIRNALKMMLEDSHQPIFGEATRMQLPTIDRVDFLEYLEFQFAATGKPADESALEHLLNLTRSHPRGTQQLAWETWQHTPAGKQRRRGRDQRGQGATAAGRPRRRHRYEPSAGHPLWLLQPLPRPPRPRPPAGPRARGRTRRNVVHRRSAVQRVAAPLLAIGRPADPRGLRR